MLRLIIFCLVISALSLGVNWLLNNDGNVNANWLGYQVSTSVSFIIVTTTLATIALVVLMYLVIWLFGFFGKVSHRREVANFNKGLTHLTEGYAAIAGGDTKSARSLAKKTMRYLGNDQPLALVLEAQAAQMEGDEKNARKNYSLLMENKATKLIGLKGLLGEAKQKGDNKKAIELAEQAFQTSKEVETIVPLLLDLYKRESKWQKALDMVEKGQGKKAFTKFAGSSFNIKREKAILLYMLARENFEQDRLENTLELSEKAYKLYPNFTPAITLIAQSSVKLGRTRKASNIISKAWKENPRPQLKDIFMHINEEDTPKKLLRKAVKLAEVNPNNVESNILVAEAAIKAEEVSKARNHLKLAMANGETVRACNLMAKLEEIDEEGNQTAVNEWLERANMATSDPGWMCSNCRSMSEKWQIVCGQCGAMDSFVWEVFAKPVQSDISLIGDDAVANK